MFKRLFLVFLLVPLVELALIFLLAHFIGWWATLGITVTSSLLGAYLAKKSWHTWWQQVRLEWSQEGFPVHRLGEGAILVTAMAFMITPGPLTGILGILFTIPAIRERVSRVLVRWLSNRVVGRFLR
ncbi:FxsA family protein [Sulfobacillus harzensis]|uniref:FxsA family protein n=1 Tax=Sulfobacillus harzensis TaxID=2729629 RepID=A0A7Y0Q4S8_9FIRM|nr:FxsA family protein [Sulfobacillus harzensis]NMP23539.1 FxsA family protein [Sulfobacillus harzensis]